MKNSRPPDRKRGDRDLPHYLRERPNLLLKMLDIAEDCWHESREPMERSSDAA